MVDRMGQQVGYYRLLRLLGSGGFADVYLGEHIHVKKQAAVKVLRTQLSKNEANNFRREAQTLAHLDNPHIIRVLDFGFDHETPFLVMEYAPNGTLRQLHPRNTTVPLPIIIAYVKQIAEALYYAHTNQVIHRDVKPENMLLGKQNELLLSDFGIATVTQSSQASNHQSIVGTAMYMAPEQIKGQPRPASDQYALAVIVYEWLVGVPPFQGSFIETSTQHLMTSPPSLRGCVSTIPLLVEQVVLTALNKEPERRFGSIQAFANALENACPASTGAETKTHPLYVNRSSLNSLPALPEAKVSESGWPTFFIESEKRNEISNGKLPLSSLGITGSIPPATDPLVPLPVSYVYTQPTLSSLMGVQSFQRLFGQAAQESAIFPSLPSIIRSYVPEKVEIPIPMPPKLLPILAPDLSLERPMTIPYTSTSGSPRRIRARIIE